MLATNIEDMGGEGFYDVVECKFDLVKEYIEEYCENPNYERFLNLVGIATFKVTPGLPEVKLLHQKIPSFFFANMV